MSVRIWKSDLYPFHAGLDDSGEEKDWEVSENLQRTPDALPFLISPPQLPGENYLTSQNLNFPTYKMEIKLSDGGLFCR